MPAGELPVPAMKQPSRVRRRGRLALNQVGLGVPHEVSLMGFDDMPHCMNFTPPLTTVPQPIHNSYEAAGPAGLRAP